MGILAEPLQFIRDLKLEPGFTVCELGDQWITDSTPHRLAKEFYKEIGCSHYESIDGNGRGTRTWDLNGPLPRLGQFDLVTDFGTGEHIFNQYQVWRSIHYLTKRFGYLVWDRPSQGYKGHCFYLADECVYRDSAAANEWDIVTLEHKETTRGELIRGVMQRTGKQKFKMPQQGRYRKLLRPITGELPPLKWRKQTDDAETGAEAVDGD